MRRISATCIATLFAGGAALPAAAQDLCAGIGASGIWIGGSPDESDIATADSAAEQLALVLANNRYVSLFSVSAPASVRMEAAGAAGGDALIELYSETGELIGFDDDSGGGTDARLEQDLGPGTYCLAVQSFDGTPMTGTVRIGRTDHEAMTAGTGGGGGSIADGGLGCDTADYIPDDSVTLEMLRSGISSTASADQLPYFRFSLSEPAAITLTAENETADPVLSLYDPSGALIDENDDFSGLNSRLDIVQPLQPGDYCVGIRALSDTGAPIRVALTAYDSEAAQAALFDQGEVAPPLDGSYPVTTLGAVDTRMRSDVQIEGTNAKWLVFDVAEPGLILIEAIAPNNDPVIQLFDDLGRSIAYNDDYGSGYDSQIAARVNPGTYLLSVKDISDGAPLIRVVLERYVPAR